MSKKYQGYTKEDLHAAISAVKQNRLKVRPAAREYGISATTIYDYIKGRHQKPRAGPDRQLMDEEESALANYLLYIARHGLAMTRAQIRCYVIKIVRRSGRVTWFNLEKGPSDEWFRKFLIRHPELSEKIPSSKDRGRFRMSNPKVTKQYFDLLKELLDEHGLNNKPSQIYNCDETGWSGKEAAKRKVVAAKTGQVSIPKVSTSDHITANLCVSADGSFLPPMIIYKRSFPQRSFNDGIPESWLFACSDTGYMDGDLFFSWFSEIFLKNCSRPRPVLLILDNHDAHITLQTVELAIANNVVMLGLPAHTIHYLQPLDVKIIGPLKNRFATMAGNLGLLSTRVTIGKSQFPVILKYAMDQATPISVQEAFAVTGVHPYNPNSFDQSQIVPATFCDLINDNVDNSCASPDKADIGSSEENVCTCGTCGVFMVNPLVRLGLVPQRIADILVPPPNGPMSKEKRSRIVSEARVLTGGEMLQQLREKEAAMLVQEIEREERAQLKEQRKEQKEKDQEERKKKKQKRDEDREQKRQREEEEKIKRAVGGRLAPIQFTCSVCMERGRVNDERNEVMWFGCDNEVCGRWFHEFCLSQCERDAIVESE